MKYSATMWPWFSSFLLNPFVSRVKRRIPIRMERFCLSTNDVLMGWDRGADLLSGLIPQIYFDYLRGGPPARLSTTTKWTYVDWRHCPLGFFRYSATLKTSGRTDWNCLVSPAS